MGCTESKLDNEDTVRRCKERRRLMKEALYARHHLAAAHSDYCRSLRNTGSALVTFASGEPLPVSHHTPAVLLRNPSSATRKPPTFIPPLPQRKPSPTHPPSLHPDPPPPPIPTTSCHQPPPPRRRKPMKLPHILSDSSLSSPQTQNNNARFTSDARANSTYVSTPSQASSVWNWDNFRPPPSPPDSEYFEKLHKNKKNHSDEDYYADYDNENEDKTSSLTSHSNNRVPFINPFSSNSDANKQFDNSSYNSDNTYRYYRQGDKREPDLRHWETEKEEGTEREEVHCSEWGDIDHYTSSSSSGDEEEELKPTSDLGTRSNFGSGKNEVTVNVGNVNSSKLCTENNSKSSVSRENGKIEEVESDKRILVRHKDLMEIAVALREYFDKAADAGEQVSEILEHGKAQLRKTMYHSSGTLSNLSSCWTSKPPLAAEYGFEPNLIQLCGGSKSLCSTLERLFAWERKLYQEVKAREGVKLEFEKKMSALRSQEYRGGQEEKLDKTKTSINRLQSLISVTSQAVSATSSSIMGLRDSDLVPQLIQLCHGFMYMWRSMNQHHEIQNCIVQQVQGLINHTTKGEPTSDLHRQATRDLEFALSTWHSSFCSMIKFHRDFIFSLHGWFKLTLHHVSSEQTKGSEVLTFLDEWKLTVDRVPDAVPSEAIKSFINVVNSILLKQAEEVKIRKQTESVSKELEKKASSVRNIERKCYRSYSMVGIQLPDNGPVLGTLAEKKVELAACKRRVEDEMVKHEKAVEVTRAMTLNNIQTGLPGVFQAVVSFSAMVMEALETVCSRSYSIQ